MNIELLELAADQLDDLLAEVVFLGGTTVGLWITDPGAPPTRTTKDVDVVVEITSRLQFNAFEDKLRGHRFVEDQMDGVICRWRHQDSGVILDAMPMRADILGFDNRWQGAAIPHALQYMLPNGREIRVASPAYLLATKLEAFASRGRGDLLGSRDFSDVITLVDGREELTGEVETAADDVRNFVASGGRSTPSPSASRGWSQWCGSTRCSEPGAHRPRDPPAVRASRGGRRPVLGSRLGEVLRWY